MEIELNGDIIQKAKYEWVHIGRTYHAFKVPKDKNKSQTNLYYSFTFTRNENLQPIYIHSSEKYSHNQRVLKYNGCENSSIRPIFVDTIENRAEVAKVPADLQGMIGWK